MTIYHRRYIIRQSLRHFSNKCAKELFHKASELEVDNLEISPASIEFDNFHFLWVSTLPRLESKECIRKNTFYKEMTVCM